MKRLDFDNENYTYSVHYKNISNRLDTESDEDITYDVVRKNNDKKALIKREYYQFEYYSFELYCKGLPVHPLLRFRLENLELPENSHNRRYRIEEVKELFKNFILDSIDNEENKKWGDFFRSHFIDRLEEAEKGKFISQYDVAQMYYRGYGTIKNTKKANEWYKRAAEHVDFEKINKAYYPDLKADEWCKREMLK